MDIDLAAFRLNALALLMRSDASSGATSTGQAGLFETLLKLQSARLSGSSGAGMAGALPGDTSARMQSVLAQLESSNNAFLQRYNARVEAIGDEATVLTRLRSRLAELGSAGDGLQQLTAASTDGEIRTALEGFIARYNQWDTEFDPYFEDGALLDDNQAGEVARFSLRREVGSIFHGAGNGGFALGLTDMGVGFTSDGQLQLDEKAFGAALRGGRDAALQTLHNVARAFSQAAETLASDGHLLDRRIDNAERAVAWAADNQDSVGAEFGPAAAQLAKWYR
ncbi:hypothetical protein [Thauera linaloolentis]|uniref:Flagellar hook-associated protein 2 C-terminal domain-containing protein n=1 Tax=Thauera linaloolentis (strain DSM 12138 / JCM 21573 / CCUG 41526 / CIP 105981 / IAM 15112 / NBRC 102519 / 47Lol) TaxID=1123367 RepID=N6YR53_THAL4|nr:hypothetical protein [Thauera linaloolentis]ENO84847.1 hypothetical protein C666_16450 [Thauera linaloolentis 47Lol = DSM 12138]MCM8564854.1 hypothetical protein [Thauera linaloolentis]